MPQPFNTAVITDNGAQLLTRAHAGEVKVEFTRIVIGNGSYSEEERSVTALQKRTGLKSQKNSYPLSDVVVHSEHSVKVTALITNQDPITGEAIINDGYYINEMGLYAKVKGGDGSTEILYSITTTTGENGDFMPPYNGYNPAQIIQDYYATVSNSKEVTICTDNQAVALAEDIEEIRRKLDEDMGEVREELAENIGGIRGELAENTGGIQTQLTKLTNDLAEKADASHTHSYAGSASAGGSAASAVKLDTAAAGSGTQPVYFSGGKPVACTYSLAKSVPANAVFTDTNTWRGVQNNLTSTATDQSLTANMGRVLNNSISSLRSSLSDDIISLRSSILNYKMSGLNFASGISVVGAGQWGIGNRGNNQIIKFPATGLCILSAQFGFDRVPSNPLAFATFPSGFQPIVSMGFDSVALNGKILNLEFGETGIGTYSTISVGEQHRICVTYLSNPEVVV